MKNFCLFILLIAVQISVGQTPDWISQLSGTSYTQANAVATDASGNTYVIGDFNGTADLDPGMSVHSLTALGAYDTYVAKFDAQGNLVWVRQYGSTGFESSRHIAIDASGAIYATGQFSGTIDFDPGTSVANLTDSGFGDIFILKLDSDGNFMWAKQIGGPDSDWCEAINFDVSGNVILSGFFGNTVDFNPGAAVFNLTAPGDDSFLCKLDTDGNFIWAKQFGGSATAGAFTRYATADTLGNIYACGNFINTVDFDAGSGVFNLTPIGSSDIFIAKYDSEGNFIWAKQLGGTNNEGAGSIAVGADNTIYTTGYFSGTADFDPGSGNFSLTAATDDIFLSKLDGDGNFVWAKSLGATAISEGRTVKLDAAGNLYVMGYFQGSADFDLGIGSYNVTSAGLKDAFILKFNADGDFINASSFGGLGNDSITDFGFDASGRIYASGYFSQTVDFDPGSGITNLTATGNSDAFLLKLDPQFLGRSDLGAGSDFRIFPNPTRGNFQIVSSDNSQISHISVSDCDGRLLKEIENADKYDLSGFPAGVYYVKVFSFNGERVQKLIKY